jgi:hypothetical protein
VGHGHKVSTSSGFVCFVFPHSKIPHASLNGFLELFRILVLEAYLLYTQPKIFKSLLTDDLTCPLPSLYLQGKMVPIQTIMKGSKLSQR